MLCKCSGKYIDIYFILKITYFYLFAACPCLPWVPRVGFYAWVTRDVTGDSVPLWVPPPRHARTLSATCLVVSTLACIVSSDRHSVALALSSSL